MTGHKGNSEFCFPEKLNVPRGKASGNIALLEETKLTVSRGVSYEVFCYTSRLKNRKSSENNYLLEAIAHTGCARKIEQLPKPTCSIAKSQ